MTHVKTVSPIDIPWLISISSNLSVLMALNGEPGWVCLMCCNCDSPLLRHLLSTETSADSSLSIVLFSAIVIQWVTSRDNAGTVSSSSSGEARRSRDLGSGINRISTPSELHETPLSTLANISLVPTRRRSRGADYVDLHDVGTPDSNSNAKVINLPSTAVMVTTTIESETRCRSYNFTGLAEESSKACGCGCLTVLKSSVVEERLLSPQTKITAGGSHFLEDFGQRANAC